MSLRSLVLLFYLLIPCSAQAHDPAPAEHPSWLRLLHYDSTLLGSWQSSVHAPDFFLTPHGRHDPQAEWNAWMQTRSPDQQRDLACRFPARVLISQRLTGQIWPVPPCVEYGDWKKRLDFHSLSLVYSTAYAGNPASVLGHNILKLNREDPSTPAYVESGLPLLDYGIGFLARSDPRDGPVFYVLNGLLGGYPGFFVLQPYYELVNTYAYAENRDLWELEIKLDADERELFLAHIWELIHYASAPYHFTHVNCSTMLLEILEAVRPHWNLRQRISGLVLPHAVMQTVAAQQGASNESFWPSQRRIFGEHWRQLNAVQQEKFLDWRDGSDAVAVADEPLVLDAIMDQLNMQKSRLDITEQSRLRVQEDQILLARSRLPASTLQPPDRSRATNNPLWAHGLHKFSLLAGLEREGTLLSLRLRWGLHDLLDEPQGFDPYYHINFFDLRLRQTTRTLALDYTLDVVDLMSLHPFERVEPSGSWAISAGLHDTEDGARPHVRGSYGVAWEMRADRSLIYALPTTKLTITSFEVGFRLGWYHAWTARWRQLLEILPRQSLSRKDRVHWDWSWEQRWSLNRSWQVEWRLAREDRWQSLVGIGQFF